MELTIEDLKCCGNCCFRERAYFHCDSVEKCEFFRGEPIESQRVCAKWEYDGVQNRKLDS